MKKIIILIVLSLFLNSCGSTSEENTTKQTNPKQEKYILSLGDSITAGYRLELEDSYPSQLENILQENGYNYKLINGGVSGDTSKQLLERIDLYLENEEKIPNLAILVIGGNDGLRSSSLENLEKNIINIIEKLKEKNIKIVLGGMQIPPNLGIKYSRDFKNMYSKIAKKQDIYLIDFFLEDVAGYRKLNLNDGIHPNKDGYKKIATNVYEFLKSKKLIKND